MSQLVDELLFGALIVGALAVVGFGAYHVGRTSAQVEAESQRMTASIAAADKFNKADRAARDRESALRLQLADRDADLENERVVHAKDMDTLRANVRAGTVRLSVPVARCEIPTGATGATPAAAAAPGDEARTDIVPGTADAIFRLAGQSADDVRDFNALIDRYNAVLSACNP